ncbi:Hypothetical protein DEACI_0688 [Acididesulfobacillus acetoxydans]|uniref:Uncharacterized protein n=1 Tax=Acididesulfobacillus acetoxydans TaxID=1561005 RepID=A0A8S0W6P6_9FIRM|nr:hypothetical protein [Acididesulfobacillus acetoxydans]CAA7600039.1 Hypothetical protein DEACI_0688 [Acididesulfobacillus acetoxydans]CEJ07814.1 Hypothetical protein DEACI_2280 [Acididesulfobacillus acetoxydans]
MGGEKEVWLGEEEIDSLLRGKLLWSDVVSRTEGAKDAQRIRRLGEPLRRLRSGSGADAQVPVYEQQVPVHEHVTCSAERFTEAGFRAGEPAARNVTVMLAVVAVLTVGSWLYFALLI